MPRLKPAPSSRPADGSHPLTDTSWKSMPSPEPPRTWKARSRGSALPRALALSAALFTLAFGPSSCGFETEQGCPPECHFAPPNSCFECRD